MEPILSFLVLGFLTYCSYGQEAKNVISRSDQVDCVETNPSLDKDVHGASDCVDRNLYDSTTGKYFAKCCYVRSMVKGNTRHQCRWMTSDDMIDITEGIKLAEEQFWKAYGMHLKIYSIDCKASYIQFSALIILLYLLKI